MQICNGCNHVKIYLKLIEVQYNVDLLFLSVFGAELAVKNERKGVSRTWKNAY